MGDMTTPLQLASLFNHQAVFVWSDCLLGLGMDLLKDLLVGYMVLVGDAEYLVVAPHFQGLYSSLELCCESP